MNSTTSAYIVWSLLTLSLLVSSCSGSGSDPNSVFNDVQQSSSASGNQFSLSQYPDSLQIRFAPTVERSIGPNSEECDLVVSEMHVDTRSEYQVSYIGEGRNQFGDPVQVRISIDPSTGLVRTARVQGARTYDYLDLYGSFISEDLPKTFSRRHQTCEGVWEIVGVGQSFSPLPDIWNDSDLQVELQPTSDVYSLPLNENFNESGLPYNDFESTGRRVIGTSTGGGFEDSAGTRVTLRSMPQEEDLAFTRRTEFQLDRYKKWVCSYFTYRGDGYFKESFLADSIWYFQIRPYTTPNNIGKFNGIEFEWEILPTTINLGALQFDYSDSRVGRNSSELRFWETTDRYFECKFVEIEYLGPPNPCAC